MILPSLLAALRRTNTPAGLLPYVTDHVTRVNRPLLKRYYRATITATGGIAKTVKVRRTGESVSDGGDVRVLVAYTTSTFGGAGGPAATDDVLIVETTPGNPVILGKYA